MRWSQSWSWVASVVQLYSCSVTVLSERGPHALKFETLSVLPISRADGQTLLNITTTGYETKKDWQVVAPVWQKFCEFMSQQLEYTISEWQGTNQEVKADDKPSTIQLDQPSNTTTSDEPGDAANNIDWSKSKYSKRIYNALVLYAESKRDDLRYTFDDVASNANASTSHVKRAKKIFP